MATTRRFCICICLIPLLIITIGLFSASLHADSTLNFPRLSFEMNTITGIAIANPTNQTAVVTLTAFGTDGKPLAASGFTNPAQLLVNPNQQVARLTSEIFGTLPPSAVGWFQATSPVTGLTGFFLYLDTLGRFFDGADLPSAARKIVFNQVRFGSGFTTELNIINTGDGSALVQLQLVGAGSSPLSQALTIPAKGVARVDAGSFFGMPATSPGAYVIAAADREISGFEFVKSDIGDLLGLNARDASEQLKTLYFPQMAVLGPWSTELGLVNYSTSPAIVAISAFKPDGTLYGTANLRNNPVTRSLASGAALREDVASLFGFSGQDVLDGWIKMESTAAAINGYISYGTGLSVAAVASTAQGFTRAIFSHIATTQGFFTGVAALNPGAVAANVRIMALQVSGQPLGTFDIVLQPGQRVSKLINEFIPQAAGQGGGLIWIRSDQPVYLTELFGTGGTLANVPAQPAPESFRPDAGRLLLKIVPPLAPVQVSSSQVFQVQNNTGSVAWKVNGIPGGNAAVGTISAAGVYAAPSAVPSPEPLTVTAETTDQIAGATVDVLKKEVVVRGLGVVQSVAYLASLKKLYVVELSAISTSRLSAASSASSVFEVTASGSKIPLTTFSNELISKMIPFTASDGKEFLLMAAQTTGRVIRLDPGSRSSADVVTGLNQPATLVIDPTSGNLLIAEADKISIIFKNALEITGSSKMVADTRKLAVPLFTVPSVSGIAVDPCTGDIFFSDSRSGTIRRFIRVTGQTVTVVSGLNDVRQLLVVPRTGVSCPLSTHLLAVERGLDRIAFIIPSESFFTGWLPAAGAADLAFIDRGNPLVSDQAVLFSEAAGPSASELALARVPDLYSVQPPNPPPPVTTAISVTVQPASVTLATGAKQQFSAVVTGTQNTAVGWSASGGMITDTGTYTAPATAGTFTVTATSVADPTKSASATVTVRIPSAGIITTIAGNGSAGFGGDGGPGTAAQLNNPFGVAVDGAGNVYIAEQNNNRIRKVSPNGVITTVAGNGTSGFSGDGGPATTAQISGPEGVAVDSTGNIYIADLRNNRIRRVTPGGIITTVAGNGGSGFSGDGGPATSAQIAFPLAVAVDSPGNIYIGESGNDRVRKVNTAGVISTFAGTGTEGTAGDGGPATSAQLLTPEGIAVDSAGNVYIADGNRVRKVNTAGTITTVAGTGQATSSGDGGPATSAGINFAMSVAVDSAGILYIAERGGNRIRRVTPADGLISTVAGTGIAGFSGDGGPATAAQINGPTDVAVDSAGNVYIADTGNQRVRRVIFQ